MSAKLNLNLITFKPVPTLKGWTGVFPLLQQEPSVWTAKEELEVELDRRIAPLHCCGILLNVINDQSKKLVRAIITIHLLVDLCLFRGIAKSKHRQVQETSLHRIRLNSIVHERSLAWIIFLHIHAHRSFVSIMFSLYIHGHSRGCKLALHSHSRGPVVLSLDFQ